MLERVLRLAVCGVLAIAGWGVTGLGWAGPADAESVSVSAPSDAAGYPAATASSSRQQEREHRVLTATEPPVAAAVLVLIVLAVVATVLVRPRRSRQRICADRGPPASVLLA